jgi:hypothetical protein
MAKGPFNSCDNPKHALGSSSCYKQRDGKVPGSPILKPRRGPFTPLVVV